MLKNTPISSEFWYFLINGIKDNTGAYANFYAYGNHCGEALNNAYLAMKAQGFSDLNVYETLRLDTLDDWSVPEDAIKVTEKVYMRPDLHYFKINSDETTFNYPDGILASTYEGEYDFEVIEEGFSADEKSDEDALYEINVVVTKEKLAVVLTDCLEILPELDSHLIFVNDFWGGQQTELFYKNISNKYDAMHFILANSSSIMDNGLIDSAFYFIKGDTYLYLDAHKTIKLTTTDAGIFYQFQNHLRSSGYNQLNPLYSIQYGFHHYHYRPFDSLDRSEFISFLSQNDFKISNSTFTSA